MAFFPEDGTGLENSNSYVDLSYADTYHGDRGNESWSNAEQGQKEAALVRATFAIDAYYEFIGKKLNFQQALEWPRKDATDGDGNVYSGVPSAVKRATSQLALYTLNNDPFEETSIDRSYLIKSQKRKVGPLETKTEYANYKEVVPVDRYEHITGMLDGLLREHPLDEFKPNKLNAGPVLTGVNPAEMKSVRCNPNIVGSEFYEGLFDDPYVNEKDPECRG